MADDVVLSNKQWKSLMRAIDVLIEKQERQGSRDTELSGQLREIERRVQALEARVERVRGIG